MSNNTITITGTQALQFQLWASKKTQEIYDQIITDPKLYTYFFTSIFAKYGCITEYLELVIDQKSIRDNLINKLDQVSFELQSEFKPENTQAWVTVTKDNIYGGYHHDTELTSEAQDLYELFEALTLFIG